MDYKSLFNNFDELNKTIEEAYAKMNAQSKGIILEASKMLFEKHSKLDAIYWAQYTPYFNDGDECVFSVHEICCYYDIDTPDEEYELDDFYPYESNTDDISMDTLDRYKERVKYRKDDWSKKRISEIENQRNENPELASFWDDFVKFQTAIAQVPDDVMKATFGDHVAVKITKTELEIEEYDHD